MEEMEQSSSLSKSTLMLNLTCLGDERHLILPYLDSFTATVQNDNAVSPDTQTVEASLAIENVARFFDFLHESHAPETTLALVGQCFERDVLSTIDIHSLALAQEKHYRSHLIRSYLRLTGHSQRVPRSALLDSSQRETVRLTAVFGGQGRF